MEKLTTIIISYSEKREYRALDDTLRGNDNPLSKMRKDLGRVLALLSPREHSLGFIHLLFHMSKEPTIDVQEYLRFTKAVFLESFDIALRFAPDRFYQVAKKASAFAIESKTSREMILPLRRVVGPATEEREITPAHAALLAVCLDAQFPNAAMRILETPLYKLDSSSTGVSARDVGLYYLYGGIIFGLMREYDTSAHFFEQAISLPGPDVSKISFEAYKKWLITSLLSNGKMPILPEITPSKTRRILERVSSSYQDVVDAFLKLNPSTLDEKILKHKKLFQSDSNLGLVNLLKDKLLKRRIQRLTRTYVTLSLEFIANDVGMSTKDLRLVESALVEMVSIGEVVARLDTQTGEVSFVGKAQDYFSATESELLIRRVRELSSIGGDLVELGNRLTSNPTVLKKAIDRSKNEWMM